MAYDFSDEDKEIREFAERIPFGVTKVQFAGAIADETEAGKDFIEIGVVTESGIEDSARLWFVGGAANISFNTALQIAVHAGKDEEEKAKIRERIEACKSNVELVEVLNDVCGNGSELWFTKYYDANGRTYTTENGTFKSVNKNVLGYEPKLKPELMPKPNDNAAKADPLAGAEPATGDAADNIPSDWAK